jgi:hypothetical protein
MQTILKKGSVSGNLPDGDKFGMDVWVLYSKGATLISYSQVCLCNKTHVTFLLGIGRHKGEVQEISRDLK